VRLRRAVVKFTGSLLESLVLAPDFSTEAKVSEIKGLEGRENNMRIVGLCGLGAVALVALGGPTFAAGDATKGKAAFAKCAICHQVGPGAKTLVGPELNNVVGRKAASIPDYPYSPGMKKLGEQGFVWTPENIDKWISNPKAMIPDSSMALAFTGVPDAAERADIIAYLQTQTGQ
jgi:cytochrome c